MSAKIIKTTEASFSGNVLKLLTGAIVAQVLGIIVMPIVTRLFAPEAFGLFTLFSSIAGIFGVIACLRYDAAIMLPDSNEEAVNILGVSLISVVVMTIFSAFLIRLGDESLIALINAPQLLDYLWIVPVAIFFQGLFLALNQWNSRTKHFGRLSIAQIVSSFTTQSTKRLAGFAGFVSAGTFIGTFVLGSIVSTAMLGGQIWHDDRKLFFENIRWRAIINGFLRFKKFPLVDTWGLLFNAVSWQLPALMLAYYFPLPIVGFYALGFNVIRTPLYILAVSFSQVFYQEICDKKDIKDHTGALVESLMDKLIFISILPTMILAIVGEELFSIAFGVEWIEAGRYTQIIAPWVFFWFISSPLSVLFSVFERQGAALSMHVIIFATRAVSLYIGGIYGNIYLALGLFSLTGVVSYVFASAWNIKLSGANGTRILSNFIKYFVRALPACFSLFLIKYILHLDEVIILLSVLLIVAGYLFAYRNKYISIISNIKR